MRPVTSPWGIARPIYGKTKTELQKKCGRRKAKPLPLAPWSSGTLFRADERSDDIVTQPWTDAVALISAAMPAYDVLRSVLQRVAGQFPDGVCLIEPSADAVAKALGDAGASVVAVLAAVKGEKRCSEKVASDYDGWDQ